MRVARLKSNANMTRKFSKGSFKTIAFLSFHTPINLYKLCSRIGITLSAFFLQIYQKRFEMLQLIGLLKTLTCCVSFQKNFEEFYINHWEPIIHKKHWNRFICYSDVFGAREARKTIIYLKFYLKIVWLLKSTLFFSKTLSVFSMTDGTYKFF